MNLRRWTALTLALLTTTLFAQEIPMGVVEGFYGTPWSHQDRLDVIDFLGEHELDLYIYAPKDDPGHRSDWRTPYSDEAMAQFRELVAACQRNGVELCFAMSPGNDMVYSDADERAVLLDKMMSLHADGVTHFALFLDDIDVERMGQTDRDRFASAVEAQMYLANRLNEEIKDREPEAWFLICPTEYEGTEPSEYWDTLREQLDSDVAVVWTGPEVISPTITDEDLDAITAHLGRPPFIWDNYPVNDFERANLFMGPLIGRTPALPSRISGYASNPMNEAHASLIPLATIADFLHDPNGYDPEDSWNRAIDEIGGDSADDLRLFTDNSRNCRLDVAESFTLNHLITVYLVDSTPEAFGNLHQAVRDLIAATERLPNTLNPPLARNLDDHIAALNERANAMELALLFIENRLTDNSDPALLRLIDRVRTAEANIGEDASERIFGAAVGLNPDNHGPFAPGRRIDAIDPPRDGQFPGSRGSGDLIIYTPAYGHDSTGTNPFGFEATIENGVVTRVGGNDSPIPANGFVVSGHSASHRWIETVLTPGMPVVYDDSVIRLGDVPADLLTHDLAIRIMRYEVVSRIADLVSADASQQAIDQARALLSRIERLSLSNDNVTTSDIVELKELLSSVGAH